MVFVTGLAHADRENVAELQIIAMYLPTKFGVRHHHCHVAVMTHAHCAHDIAGALKQMRASKCTAT